MRDLLGVTNTDDRRIKDSEVFGGYAPFLFNFLSDLLSCEADIEPVVVDVSIELKNIL